MSRFHNLAWVATCGREGCATQVAVKKPAAGEKPGERLCENCRKKARRKSAPLIRGEASQLAVFTDQSRPRAFIARVPPFEAPVEARVEAPVEEPVEHDPADGDLRIDAYGRLMGRWVTGE